ncbi:hypothetical protein BOX15_Mlig003967g3 [Macrostomum lignano]|nr:hypothetical protein BOX15_Mlig003967g2 [Macrostomum lignano]PAA54681.1 hypothetical protein BOX15_Mlig003967g1 [Macrostomum lignano]PAA76597.1 hypothetical protein BOX15_Mlig003967g3 [Macrostomum lignano]
MPVRKEDATRALELLEQYHRRLNTTEDAQLRASIERVIKIFKSKLFNALLDIQEFYEVTLIDENKTAEQRALESVKEPDRWAETAPPSHQPGAAKQKSQKQHRDSPERAAAAAASASDGAFEIVLQRASQGGFGFSIAGGVDEPHLPGDSRVFVTKVVPGGVAELDGRMRVDDVILAVNGVDVTAVSHAAAVNALKMSGNQLRLLLLRAPMMQQQPPPQQLGGAPQMAENGSFEVILTKTLNGLGFSIAGGVDNQHLAGDDSIFVTKIIDGGAAQQDGSIEFGDRLLAVDGVVLHGCTHQQAVATLKATGDRVRLVVQKPTPEELALLVEAATLEEAGAAAVGYQPPPMPVKKGSKKDKKKKGSESGHDAPHEMPDDEMDGGHHEAAEVGKAKKGKGIGSLFGMKKK